MLRFIVIIWFAAWFSPLGWAEPVRSAHVEAELVSEVASIRPGEPFWAALRLRMDPGWHIYWKNPGDAGLATTLDWFLPKGFQAGEIEWPHPERIDLPPLAVYAYEGETFLLAKVIPPDTLPAAATQTLRAHAAWLACEIECVAGEADLALDLPVANEVPRADDLWLESFSSARFRLPLAGSDWKVRAEEQNDYFTITVTPPSQTGYQLSGLHFFPDRNDLIEHAREQVFQKTGSGYALSVRKSRIAGGPVAKLTGILVSSEGWRGIDSERALAVDVAIDVAAGIPTVWTAFAFAFLGGLILNLMPCVLPVLSIKALHFVDQARAGAAKPWVHGLIFTAGVLVSFWLLAGALIALRAGGAHIGWGFQLQSPVFVVFLTALFFMFGLNLFGIYEIGTPLPGLGGTLAGAKGWFGTFASGALATIVATPCTAPFMGSALGFALAQPVYVAFGVFTALALGMASPYVLLSANPRLLALVPKPGPWMIYLKTLLGAFLMATVLWLLTVLTLQIGLLNAAWTLGGLFVMGLGAYYYGIASKSAGFPTERASKPDTFGNGTAVAIILIVCGLALGIAGTRLEREPSPAFSGRGRGSGLVWEPYSAERLQKLRAEGRPVLIDFTAAWCLTCQVNERAALRSARVVRAFNRSGVRVLKADWTSRDERIAEALRAYGRSSIPLYVLYGSGSDVQPILLPELLTPDIVLEALEEALAQ